MAAKKQAGLAADDSARALDGKMGALAKVREEKRQAGPIRGEPTESAPEAMVVEVGDDGSVSAPIIDMVSGAIMIQLPDGSVDIDFNPRKPSRADLKHDDNLALELSDLDLNTVAEEVLQGIEADIQSRSEWLGQRAKGIDLLGVKLDPPRGTTGESAAPLEGMSNVRHPALLEAVLRYQANANGELLPAGGPVKVRNDSVPKPASSNAVTARVNEAQEENKDTLAEALEKDFNHYLTAVATEYYPDTDRMLFMLGAGGVGIKKVYNHPIKRRPVLESVNAEDFIVSNMATDLDNAERKTHRILMSQSVMKRMKLLKIYRDDAAVDAPSFQPDLVQSKSKEVQGINAQPTRPEDQPFTLYETLVDLDVPGFEHKERGKPTGIPLPYRITIDSQSRQVLELRRNWEASDKEHIPKKYFVKYGFIPAFGFWDLGLIHILGNTTSALTAAWREMLDAGMFANFPGFLYSNSLKRQVTNNFRIPPGGGMGIETGNKPIGDVVMPLPYKQPAAEFQQFIGTIGESASRLGATAELPIGEGKQDAPVGTTLALLEQATKIVAAVHKRNHASQAEEFMLLRDRFREDPESFWRRNKKPATQWSKELFLKALDQYDLVPQADPNTPSHMHRLMKAVAIKQLQAANPELYDGRAVDTFVLKIVGVEDPEALFMPSEPPPPPQPNIDQMIKMAEVFIKAKKLEIESRGADLKATEAEVAAMTAAEEMRTRLLDSKANRETQTGIAVMRETTARMKLVSDVVKTEQTGLNAAQESAFTREDRTRERVEGRQAQVEDRDFGRQAQVEDRDTARSHQVEDRDTGRGDKLLETGLQRSFAVEDKLEEGAQAQAAQTEAARADFTERSRQVEDRDFAAAEKDKDREIAKKGLAIKAKAPAKKPAARKPARKPKPKGPAK